MGDRLGYQIQIWDHAGWEDLETCSNRDTAMRRGKECRDLYKQKVRAVKIYHELSLVCEFGVNEMEASDEQR